MIAPLDLLQAVARAGPLTQAALHRAVPAPSARTETGFLAALDACVDAGYLALRWRHGAPLGLDEYRLTPRARRFLLATAGNARAS